MPELAEHLSGFTESVIRMMTRLAQQHGAVNLAQGFPDFDPPAALIAAAHRALDGDCHQYAITWGAKNFRQALANKISRGMRLQCEADRHLVVTCGSTEAMLASLMSVCNAGDKVVVFSPFYENYGADTILCGATPIFVHLEPPNWHFDREELRRAFAQGVKAIVLCNPSNPTGRVFSESELLFILELAEEYDAFVVTDEVYEHIVYPPNKHVYMSSLPGATSRVIMCGSLSKTYSITGWRLGWVFARPDIIDGVRKVHDFLTVGAAAPLQQAAVTALELPDSYYVELVESYARKRSLFLEYLEKAGLSFTQPEGAYYVLVDISSLGFKQDQDCADWFCRTIGVAGVPGSSFFPEPRHDQLRFHFAKREETLHAAGQRLLELPKRI
jgi:L-glutamine---4-(methylsulfanyl)-2-oxobutanoate aminotransferase